MSEEQLTFKDLEQKFLNLFGKSVPDGQGENWCFVKVKDDEYFHYELIQHNNDCYIELHLENGASNRNQRIEVLKNAYNANLKYKRNIVGWSYYSSYFWQSRRPIMKDGQIEDDLKLLQEMVKSSENILNNANNSLIQVETSLSNTQTDECQCIVNGMCHLECIARQLGTKMLNIPSVQRGFVWNAARISALWDSILRGFPIGAFSIRKTTDGGIDLLDGQQRASSIAIGFYAYPPRPNQLDERDTKVLGENDDFKKELANSRPILWIDLNGDRSGTEKEYLFYVTTMAHPWGYDISDDETRNASLSTSEKRDAVTGLDFADKGYNCNYDEKPFPYELFPVKANAPAPFVLVKEYAASIQRDLKNELTIESFCEWVKETEKLSNLENVASEWNWLKNLDKKSMEKASINKIIKAIHEFVLDKGKTRIYCTDATELNEKDIALYFTRIGKGGVRPSDEELAFSVLKSKLGDNFKNTIDMIALKGFVSPARLAHLAVRCFASNKTSFWNGNILSRAIEISMNEEEKGEFSEFVEKIGGLVDRVIDISKDKFKQWHLARYGTVSNGDILLFLLLEYRDYEQNLDEDALRATIAVIDLYGNVIDRCFRFIREFDITDNCSIKYSTRLKLGLAKALREYYRNKPILQMPHNPDLFDLRLSADDKKGNMEKISNFLNTPSSEADLLMSGYDNQKMYSILLYACENLPDYTPYSAKWAEENCPWDYDHILPKSWVESRNKNDACKKLINSIGNLAPLPFSLNRHLSDNERLPSYPLPEDCDISSNKIQQSLLIEETFRGYKTLDVDNEEYFCETTIRRFNKIYKKWYDGLKIKSLLDYNALEGVNSVINRARLLVKLKDELKGYKITAVMPNGVEEEIRLPIDFYRYEWLSLQKDYVDKSYSIAFSLNSRMDNVEIGLRKESNKATTTKEAREAFKNCSSLKEMNLQYQENNSYWYFWRDLSNEDLSNEKNLVETIKNLEEFSKSL